MCNENPFQGMDTNYLFEKFRIDHLDCLVSFLLIYMYMCNVNVVAMTGLGMMFILTWLPKLTSYNVYTILGILALVYSHFSSLPPSLPPLYLSLPLPPPHLSPSLSLSLSLSLSYFISVLSFPIIFFTLGAHRSVFWRRILC